MGMGIWSMHYIGMLAFSLPMPVVYDWPTVVASFLAAIFASGVALFVVSRPRMGLLRRRTGQRCHGHRDSGHALYRHGCHAASCQVQLLGGHLVSLSIVLAIVISLVALWLTFQLRDESRATGWRKTASAC